MKGNNQILHRLKIASGAIPALTLAVCMIMPLTACTGNKNDNDGDLSRQLYEKSVRLMRLYADSITHAKDSATLLAMMQRYDDSLTTLNYDYPANADLLIDEGENDTIKMLSMRIVHLRDSLLLRMSGELPVDSISAAASDSVDNQTQAGKSAGR